MTIYKVSNGKCYANFIEAMESTKSLLLKKVARKADTQRIVSDVDFNIVIKDNRCILRGYSPDVGKTLQCSFRIIPVDTQVSNTRYLSRQWSDEAVKLFNEYNK